MTMKIYALEDIKEMLNEVLMYTEKKPYCLALMQKNKLIEQSNIDLVIDSNGKIKGLKYFAII